MKQKRKNARTLDMYSRLCEGKTINKREEALRFGVDERSIQRDIDDIRGFLSDQSAVNACDTRTIVYDRTREGYVMQGDEGSLMTNDEVLAVSKILLESRAFTKKEMRSILDKLISGCVPEKSMKMVSDLIANEKYHYVELRHQSGVKDKLWKLGEEIRDYNLIEIIYQKQVSSKEKVTRVIQPVALLFSEYYFYLNAFIVEKNEAGRYERMFDYPTVFRVDRIVKVHELGEKFKIAYANRFEEGAFRKRVQFMFPGDLINLQFRYTGRNVEALFDRLPTAKVLSENEEETIIEAEVYGKGILMWLLSQGDSVEVLRPQSMREEAKNILLRMLEKY
jgi:predicted DNA-binding transcriptional regulator YafY